MFNFHNGANLPNGGKVIDCAYSSWHGVWLLVVHKVTDDLKDRPYRFCHADHDGHCSGIHPTETHQQALDKMLQTFNQAYSVNLNRAR